MLERVERIAHARGLPPGGAIQVIAAANALMGIVAEPMTPLPEQLASLEAAMFPASCWRRSHTVGDSCGACGLGVGSFLSPWQGSRRSGILNAQVSNGGSRL